METPLQYVRRKCLESTGKDWEISCKHCATSSSCKIGIADILLALEEKHSLVVESPHAYDDLMLGSKYVATVLNHYDLAKDDIERQKPETVKAIAKLLGYES